MSSVTFAAYQRQVEPTPGHSHHAEPIAAGLPALPDGVTGSETALVFCREFTVDEWKTLGRELSQSERTLAQSERSIQWWIGDWWCYGNHSYAKP
jgi:hypothetical protein